MEDATEGAINKTKVGKTKVDKTKVGKTKAVKIKVAKTTAATEALTKAARIKAATEALTKVAKTPAANNKPKAPVDRGKTTETVASASAKPCNNPSLRNLCRRP